MPRQIILIDLDAFFASVEELLDPSLVGKPLIVGGPGRRGVVASASYAARAYGVKAAMPIGQALKLCPQAIVRPGHFIQYGKMSLRAMRILGDYTPLVEQVSVDEAFLDVTGCQRLFGPVEEIARTIQVRIRDELGLSSSLGVASNKLVAKIAAELGKPGGLIVVPPGQEAGFLAPLPVEILWGVGEVTQGRLHQIGVRTIGELRGVPREQLQREFGVNGLALYEYARGIDESPVVPDQPLKSMGHEQTFERDIADPEEAARALLELCEKVGRRLRHGGMQGRTITLKLRHSDFRTLTRAVTLRRAVDADQAIYREALRLLRRHWAPRTRLRLIGVSISNLKGNRLLQLNLFEGESERLERLSRALDSIRERYGEIAVQRASLLGSLGIERLQDVALLEKETTHPPESTGKSGPPSKENNPYGWKDSSQEAPDALEEP